MPTALSICNEALADIGTRSKITAVFPPDGSQEAYYCNLYFNDVMLQALRAAHWNFAKRTDILSLWKALPGTPEVPTLPNVNNWSRRYPQPPWVYSYIYPPDCVQARRVVGQPQQVPIAPPIFSGNTGTNPPIQQRLPSSRFEIATDIFDVFANLVGGTVVAAGPVAINSSGFDYEPGDLIALTNLVGNPTVLTVETVSAGGALTSVSIEAAGTYPTAPTTPIAQSTTSWVGLAGTGTNGIGFGGTFTPASFAPFPNPDNVGGPAQKVVLTMQEQALMDYTWANANVAEWDQMFVQVMVNALAGKLAQPLTGDKALARDKINIANSTLLTARVADGNEGLTINDHIPDWIRTRGAGGGLGYEMFFYPLGPLFPVAPLV